MINNFLSIKDSMTKASKLLASFDADYLWNGAKSWYCHNKAGRTYHNYTHASKVVRAVLEIRKQASFQLLLAALWHDAVYVPGASSNHNEACSVAALKMCSALSNSLEHAEKKWHLVIVDMAAELILKTTLAHHLSDFDYARFFDANNIELMTLLDADLSSLAASYTEFEKNQHNILKENGLPLTKENFKKTSDFLKSLQQCRVFIYHTAYARSNWEALAQSNINNWVKQHA
jgi:predicted metal-dependent HD superfamily phosphohydrolase